MFLSLFLYGYSQAVLELDDDFYEYKKSQKNINKRQHDQEAKGQYHYTQDELDDADLYGFHDDGVGVFFNKNGDPLAYDDGGDLEYDDDENIIIFDSVTDEPLGYIIENEDGEYEFYEYEEGGDILDNSIEVTKNALSGYKKLGKKVWGLFVWQKKDKKSKKTSKKIDTNNESVQKNRALPSVKPKKRMRIDS